MIHDIFLTFNDDRPGTTGLRRKKIDNGLVAGLRKSTNMLQRHEHPKKAPDEPVDALLEDVRLRISTSRRSVGSCVHGKTNSPLAISGNRLCRISTRRPCSRPCGAYCSPKSWNLLRRSMRETSEIEPGNQFRSETGEGGSIDNSQQAGGQVRSVASLRRVEWTASKLSFGAICARAHAELSAER